MNSVMSLREMDRAFRLSDASYVRHCFPCVKTTRIFCRPSCRAKKPLAKNVEFFRSASDALKAGYRPCKRCRPDASGQPPEWAAGLLTRIEAAPQERLTAKDLQHMDISPARA